MKSNETQVRGRALVAVAKPPLEGLVKTRLSPCLSPANAAALYKCLLDDIIAKLAGHDDSEFWLAFTPGGERYFSRNYPAIRLLAQRGKHLGERLHHIFVDLFRSRYDEILVADTDSPTVPIASVEQAYRQLSEEGCDLVLGPSDDGGYYLIGLRRPVERIFHDIPWSTGSVLDATLTRARELALKVGLLPPAYDVDVEADLRRLWDDFGRLEKLRQLAPRTYGYLQSLIEAGSLSVHASVSGCVVTEARNYGKH